MKLLRTKIIEFYRNQAKENPSNARVSFSTANKLLQRRNHYHNTNQPVNWLSSAPFLQTRSALFANASVVLLRTQLIRNSPLNYHMEHLLYVRKIISTSLPKSCSLDPLPTSLLKKNIDIILLSINMINKIGNKSITSGCFPSIYKTAQVTPLLKKSSLDTDTMKNYRPVSN